MPLSLSSLIRNISPGWAFRRAQQAYALDEFEKRRYELASPKFTKYGHGHESSINGELQSSLRTMQSRARVAEQNSPFVQRALNVLADHVVGEGITPHAEGKNKALRRIIDEFLLTNEVDAEGQTNIKGLQHQFAKARARDGEALLVRVDDPDSMLGFRIKLLEADHLDNLRPGMINGTNIREGVEFNKRGRRVAYHLFPTHPRDPSRPGIKSMRVPAEAVFHGFWPDNPGQIRGVPDGHASLVMLGELEEYMRATVMGQKVAAAFGVILEDSSFKTTDDKKLGFWKRIIPGSVMRTRPNSNVKTVNPPQTNHFLNYVLTVLRAVSAGYGIPYELLTGDFSAVNYSSYRSRMLDFQKTIRRKQQFEFKEGFCAAVNRWVYEAMEMLMYRRGTSTIHWSPQPVDIIDPTKEVPAKILELRAGLDTLENALRTRGRNVETVFAEIARVNKAMDEYAIILDTDPRNKDRGGQHQDMKSTLEATDAKAA